MIVPYTTAVVQVWEAIWEAGCEKRLYTLLHPDFWFYRTRY